MSSFLKKSQLKKKNTKKIPYLWGARGRGILGEVSANHLQYTYYFEKIGIFQNRNIPKQKAMGASRCDYFNQPKRCIKEYYRVNNLSMVVKDI